MISFLIEENNLIKKFLEGDDTYVPTSEFIFLNARPLLRPNFITQIDDVVRKVGLKIQKAQLTGKPIEDLENLAIELGVEMDGDMTDEKASRILKTLRKVYVLCNELDGKLK